MLRLTRRQFLRTATALAAAGGGLGQLASLNAWAQAPLGERPSQDDSLEVLNPRGRVPMSFVIDDSTCLVNMGHFCMPQFATAWPDREAYKKPWQTWPREIPDAFVREFGQWCAEQGVRGKYSIVPYPALVGRLDRELPGWSRRQLLDSLQLVRDLMVPNWDIHPEMITHTRVIDLHTGHPFEEISSATMENSYPQGTKSVDELAEYLAYALKILRNCDLPCEGITTPGGFGNAVKPELSLAVHQAVRDVYGVRLPHYFKYVSGSDESTEPKLEHVSGLDTDDPQVVVNVPAGTGDWFGGWDGDREPEGFRYANADATEGRMVEMIQRGEPAIMLCHWPGMYTQGTKSGFAQFQQVVLALNQRYHDQTQWMKLSEIARYWAAKGLTKIQRQRDHFTLSAPFASPQFTVRFATNKPTPPTLEHEGKSLRLVRVQSMRELDSGTWFQEGQRVVICVDLPRGSVRLTI